MGDYGMLHYAQAMRNSNEKMEGLLKSIRDISCGEEQVAENDGESLLFIFKLISKEMPNL